MVVLRSYRAPPISCPSMGERALDLAFNMMCMQTLNQVSVISLAKSMQADYEAARNEQERGHSLVSLGELY